MLEINDLKKKFVIERFWNQLIFDKYRNLVKIDKNKIENDLEELIKNNSKILSFNLSEIIFLEKNKEAIEKKSEEIITSIEDIGFKLINIKDYVKFYNDDQNIYIILCNIKFDKEILKNVNYNKIINLNICEIEDKFIDKYSKIYNLIIFDEYINCHHNRRYKWYWNRYTNRFIC